MGVNVGFSDPYITPEEPPSEPDIGSLFSGPGFASGQCRVEGIIFPCHEARRLLASRTAVQCPNNDCYPQALLAIDEEGNARSYGWRVFMSSGWFIGDGESGEYLFHDDLNDVEFGLLSQGLASSFMSLGQKKKKRRSGRRREVSIGADVGPSAGIFRRLPLTLEGFDQNQEGQVRAAFNRLLSDKCAAAFRAAKANLKTPLQVAQQGLVIRPAWWLIDRSWQQLGLGSEAQRRYYKDQFYTGTAYANHQGGTVLPRDTTDGRTHIYLRDSAFHGESWTLFSLQDVVSHEFIHGGGQRGTPRLFVHDLTDFGPHDGILKACR